MSPPCTFDRNPRRCPERGGLQITPSCSYPVTEPTRDEDPARFYTQGDRQSLKPREGPELDGE